MSTSEGWLRRVRQALADEPKLRPYLLGSLIDDVGVAVALWARTLMVTNLCTTQRERMHFMLPMIAVMILGGVVAGPLADKLGRGGAATPAALARWRWRLLVWGRGLETAVLATMVVSIAAGEPTLGRVLPYTIVSSFTKTALAPTRQAFFVDLLKCDDVQIDDRGRPLLDEAGLPRRVPRHMFLAQVLVAQLAVGATLVGLLSGGQILAAVGGRFWMLMAFDVGTNAAFLALFVLGCHPDKARDEVGVRDLLETAGDRASAAGSWLGATARHLWGGTRDAARFVFQRDQRPLLVLLAGAWVVEFFTEFYDGKLVVRHTLLGTDDAVRWAELAFTATPLALFVALPAISRRLDRIGPVFVACMLMDGLAVALAGQIALPGATSAIVPFSVVLAIDHGLTTTSRWFADVAMQTATSASMRGRLAAAWQLFVLVTAIFGEGIATELTDRFTVGGTMLRIGLAQVALMIVLSLFGGRALFRFGLRTEARTASVR